MKRGEIWTVADGPDYGGKPRPVALLQDDRFEDLLSVTFLPIHKQSDAGPFISASGKIE